MKLEKHHYFFLFVTCFSLCIISDELFSDGMFMDGLLYADISRNMAESLGSFWQPHLTHTLFNEFYEHPPLALWLQSIFFNLFGDNIYVERFYSLLTYLIVGYLIVLIWSKLTRDNKTGWIPLFLWLNTSGITWAAANNILENTMSIFVCLSVLFYLNSLKKRRFLWLVLSGISLFLGLLTKGLLCLYIWGIPFIMWAFIRKRSFQQMILDSVIIVTFTILPIALLFFGVPKAQNSILNYFNSQVIGSIQNIQTVDSRFAIIGEFIKSISIPLIFGLIIMIVFFLKKVKKSLFNENLREALMFLTIVLSGVIPIMISMKQRGFYILTVYPLFSIGLAYYLYPLIKPVFDKLKTNQKGFKIFKGMTFGIILGSIGLSANQINRIGRDKDIILDSKAVIDIVGRNTTINICPEIHSIWSLHGYMSRYGNISLDDNQNNIHQYYLSLENCNKRFLEDRYDLIPIKTKKYKLYKRKGIK